MPTCVRGLLVATAWWWAAGLAWGQVAVEIDREPISYHTTPGNDAITRLQARIAKGEVKLTSDDEGSGYLRSLLAALGVPESSQALVFSKTSFQHTRIAPKTPRAIYFGDDIYVGYVRGGDVLEIAAVDAKLGATFYLLEQEPGAAPRFVRQTDACLQCHHSGRTRDVPGHLVRSVYSDRRGFPVFGAGSFVTDHTSPLAERWGGWYVTGTHGDQKHLGNVTVTDPDHPDQLDLSDSLNRTDLKGLVDTGPYLTRHSDIVALMVMEHQSQTHNQLAQASYQARLAAHYDAGINKALGRPVDEPSPSTGRRLDTQADAVLKALLFSEEARLTEHVAGTSGFTEDFPKRGPRDHKGRSLRDFDLNTRLFRYPCSYLIHTDAFVKLPASVKQRVDDRLLAILTGKDDSPAFSHLSPADRRAILEILRETRKDLPESWRAPTDVAASR